MQPGECCVMFRGCCGEGSVLSFAHHRFYTEAGEGRLSMLVQRTKDITPFGKEYKDSSWCQFVQDEVSRRSLA